MREIIHFQIFMDWCAILYIFSIYITAIIQRTLFMSQIAFESHQYGTHLFHSIAQTLNDFISKRRFGKIAPIPEHLKKYIMPLISMLEIYGLVHTN